MTDTMLLRAGTVYDGLGSPGRRADVLISGGRIAEVGERVASAGAEMVDCEGLAVCPGFIDVHAHSDALPLLADPVPFKLLQGVTTEVCGNCGISMAPLDGDSLAQFSELYGELATEVQLEPGTFGDFLDRIERAGPTNNMAVLVGHNTLRLCANGAHRELRPGALATMRALASEAFEAGAIGFSSGLIYVPGSYSDTDELVDIAEVAAAFGRVYTTHMRDEGAHMDSALDEAMEIGRRAGIRVQISHCKAAGRRAHGRGGEVVARIAQARLSGMDVLGDQYPYTAGSTVLCALLPTEALVGGAAALRARLRDPATRGALRQRADLGGVGGGLWGELGPADVLVVSHTDTGSAGRTLEQIAGDRDPWETLCDLLVVDPTAMTVLHLMVEEDVRRIMADPLVAIGSDNGPPVGLQHPRTWGCFPRLLGTYVRDEHVLPLQEAIRKATSMPARHFGLTGRGVLRPGAVGDVCVFDPETVGHAGTYVRPEEPVTGITYVLLAGRAVVREGAFTGDRVGRVLRAGRD